MSQRGGSPQPRSHLRRFIKTRADVHSRSQSVAASGNQTEKVMTPLLRSAAAAEASDEQHKGADKTLSQILGQIWAAHREPPEEI